VAQLNNEIVPYNPSLPDSRNIVRPNKSFNTYTIKDTSDCKNSFGDNMYDVFKNLKRA
jgi:hypothetical protein